MHAYGRTTVVSWKPPLRSHWVKGPMWVGYGNSPTFDTGAWAYQYAVVFGRSDIERRRLMMLIC